MNFDFSDDQKALKDQARKFLTEKAGAKVTRGVLNDDTISFDRDLWRAVAEMGWLGAAIPEEHGGLGLGRLELCVLAEELGRAVAPIPFSSTVYFFAEALMLAGSDAQKQALLPKVAAGEIIGCFAVSEGPGAPSPESITAKFDGSTLSGVKIPVTDGDVADYAVIAAKEGGGVSLVLVDLKQAGVTRTTLQTLDPTRGHAKLEFKGVKAERLGAAGQGWELAEAVLDRAAVLIAFEQIGGSQACLEMALDYAKSRYAFSRQIGSFQAIKHKLADMYVAIEVARSNTYYGAWALSTEASELPFAAAASRAAASDAYYLCSKENIQTHGGMGFTWEVDCHLFFRRSKLLAVQAGSPAVWKEKLVKRLEQPERGVMASVIFEKRDGKYDAMFVERGGRLEEIACPKQPPIPHDMFHYAIERVLEMRGFIHRAAAGEGVGFRMTEEAESEAVERLVETMQADSWSGRPPPADVIDMFLTTCAARSTNPITVSEEAILAIRAEIDRLAAEWNALPTRGRMTLEV